MSEYVTTATEYKIQEVLLAALRQTFGIEPEVGEGLALYGYGGDARQQTADIVVRRYHLTSASNDLGFRWDPTAETYHVVISEYDQRAIPRKMKALKSEYGRQYVYAVAQRRGLDVEEIPRDGVLRLRLRPRPGQGGRARLQVRR